MSQKRGDHESVVRLRGDIRAVDCDRLCTEFCKVLSFTGLIPSVPAITLIPYTVGQIPTVMLPF